MLYIGSGLAKERFVCLAPDEQTLSAQTDADDEETKAGWAEVTVVYQLFV